MDEQLRSDWLNKANKSFVELMKSETETVFDSFLFDDQFANFVCRSHVTFPDNQEKAFRVIRAARLKISGYKWIVEGKYWAI